MVTFDHREPGTPEQAWVAAGIVSRPAPLVLHDVDAAVLLAAHPDDESLGAGGLAQRLEADGVPVVVVVATDGEASHPSAHPDDLRATRRRELVAALAAVCPSARLVLLALPDGGLREHRDVLRDGLTAACDTVGGKRLLVCAPWRGDGHRDHRVAGEVAADVAARRGARLLEYPIWFWHWGDPEGDDLPWDDLRGLTLTSAESAAKEKAVLSHASQVNEGSGSADDPPIVGAELIRHATRPVEVFVEVSAAERADAASSLDRAFFDDFYRGRDDPWGFESRWYEERKRAVLLAALPRPRFHHALELGCSTGVLTAAIAERCDRVTGVDVTDAALDAARNRLEDRVTLLRLDTPHQWPEGTFDLIVLSEVLYYYGRDDLDRTLDHVVGSLDADGVVVACHWRHDVPEYPLSGDGVHVALRSRPELDVLVRHEEEDFVLEVLARPPLASVARETGMLP